MILFWYYFIFFVGAGSCLKFITKLFTNFLHSGHTFTYQQTSLKLRLSVLNFAMFLALLGLLLALPFNYTQNHFLLINLEMVVAAGLAILLILLRMRLGLLEVVLNGLMIISIIFFDLLILYTEPEEMKFAWIYIFVSVFIYLKGYKDGLLWLLAYIGSVLIMYALFSDFMAFSLSQLIYLIMILLISASLIAYFVYTIDRAQKLILLQKEDLERHSKELEDECNAMIADKDIWQSELTQQMKFAQMGEMMSNIAHQWKQPLNSISVQAGSMRIDAVMDELQSEAVIENIDKINATLNYLSQTVDDFYDYFKPEHGIRTFESVDLIQSIIHLTEAQAKVKGVLIQSDIDAFTIEGYKNLMVQAIINFVHNAIDAFDDKSVAIKLIRISCKLDDEKMLITVLDSAGGIESDVVAHLFELYYTTKERGKGSGMGLAISKGIIEKQLHGKIRVFNRDYEYESMKLHGAEFSAEIPIRV